MARKYETVFGERVARDLDELPDTWHEKIQQVAIRGTPDRLVCMRGHFIALELKRSSKEKPDRLQAHKLEKISEAGGHAYIVNPENWMGTLEHLKAEFLDGPGTTKERQH